MERTEQMWETAKHGHGDRYRERENTIFALMFCLKMYSCEMRTRAWLHRVDRFPGDWE